MNIIKAGITIIGIAMVILLSAVYAGVYQLEKNNNKVEYLIQKKQYEAVDIHFNEHGGIIATLDKMQRRAKNLRSELKVQQREATEEEERSIALVFLQGFHKSDDLSKIHFYNSVKNLNKDIKSFLTKEEYTNYKDEYIEITTNYRTIAGLYTQIQKHFG
tara:strand:+ start:6209 stop:6688 length:480 start_codon:yes stop_codon:yes gene_type:complete